MAGAILLLCALSAWLRWLKIETLVWGDPARWLFEAQRLASGETPYRDFSWQYPPFSILLLGWAMRGSASAFTAAQIVIDGISLALVGLAWLLVRRLLPAALHLPAIVFFLAVCVTSPMFFNLFSFLTYVPSLQTGAAGFLLLLLGVLKYAGSGRMTPGAWLAIAAGAFIAAYSKPESLLASYATLGALAIFDRRRWFQGRTTAAWIGHYARLCAVSVLPAAAAYGATGWAAGFANMKAGITGYGLAGSACPWWPTGLGVFGAASALGEAAFIAAVFSLTRRRDFAARFGRRYHFGLAAGVAGALVYAAYVFYNNWGLLTGSRPLVEKIWYSAPSTVGTSAVLLPVMWSAVALWIGAVLRSLLRGSNASLFELSILLTGPVAMSARGWFTTTLDVTTQVPAICYPFFLLLGPYLLWRLLMLPGSPPGRRPYLAVAAALAAYALLRVAAAYPSLLADRPYGELATQAGRIRVLDFAGDAEIYRFVVENTAPGDAVLDIPYGGGINVAARRPSPFFDTQFRHLSIADWMLQRDFDGLLRRPPRVVIAQNEPNYGAINGLRGCSCAFPHLVWAPPRSVSVDRDFPVFAYIAQHYRVAKIVGSKLLLVPIP